LGVLAVGGRVKWGRVRVLGRVDGRVQRVRCWVRVQQVPIHDILVCPELLTFEVAREGSRVGVGEDVVQLRQNVSGISLKRLLRNCPVCHSKQQGVLLEHREGGEGGKEPPVCIERKRHLADGGEPAKGYLETLRCEREGQRLRNFFLRGRRRASTSAPVISPWRTVIAMMMSRGER
jgi:hypothetical protein